jgi:hypothetical protein
MSKEIRETISMRGLHTKHTHLQAAQAQVQTKACKRANFANGLLNSQNVENF